MAVVAGEVRWTRVVEGGALASTRMLPLALEALAACGIGVRELDAVAFGAGPGAFTGLRCACAVAQGLAFGAGIPVVAVDSLMLVAQDARAWLQHHGRRALWVAMDARMDEVYAARYVLDGERWRVDAAPALYTLEALAARWLARAPEAVAGSAVQAFAGRLPFGNAHHAGAHRGSRRGAARAWRCSTMPMAQASRRRRRCRCTCATKWR